MPVPCKMPRFRYKKTKSGMVRLTFCGNKVVEAKKKKVIDLERKHNRKIHKGLRGGYYYKTKGRKVYVG